MSAGEQAQIATQQKKPIPEALVYERVNGQPIYYYGYQDYLKGEKALEDIMGSR
jgi:hypothetical protein